MPAREGSPTRWGAGQSPAREETALRPRADLARFVDEVRLIDPIVGQPFRAESLPDGKMSMLLRITAGDPTSPHGRAGDLSISGPRTRALYKTVSNFPFALLVRFRPGGARALVGASADELTDRIVRIEDLWGREGADLRDRLIGAPGPSAMLEILQDALAARASRAAEPTASTLARRALRLLDDGPAIRVDELAMKLGVSSRHLNRAFTATVGVGPREYAKMARLQRAIFASATESSFARVASIAGYYDQAHMNADFRALLGATPREFVRTRRAWRW